jgi:putative transposase
MQSRMTTDLALQALLSAVVWVQPKLTPAIHPTAGSQFSSKEWHRFLGKPTRCQHELPWKLP